MFTFIWMIFKQVHYKNNKCDTMTKSSVILPLLYAKEYLVIRFEN